MHLLTPNFQGILSRDEIFENRILSFFYPPKQRQQQRLRLELLGAFVPMVVFGTCLRTS